MASRKPRQRSSSRRVLLGLVFSAMLFGNFYLDTAKRGIHGRLGPIPAISNAVAHRPDAWRTDDYHPKIHQHILQGLPGRAGLISAMRYTRSRWQPSLR